MARERGRGAEGEEGVADRSELAQLTLVSILEFYLHITHILVRRLQYTF